jgi:hypothetical protein
MVALSALCGLLRRPADTLSLLGGACLIVLAIDPSQVRDPAFQLSFLAVLAISTAAPRLAPGSAPDWFRGIALTLACGMFTAPVIASHFGAATPVVGLANLLLAPFFTLATVAGFIHLATSWIPGLDGLTGLVLGGVLTLIEWGARMTAELPFGYFPVAAPPTEAIVLYAIGVGTALTLPVGFARSGLLVVLSAWFAVPWRSAEPQVVALEIGPRTCVWIKSSEGLTVAVIRGGETGGSTVRRLVDHLKLIGELRIDLLVCDSAEAIQAAVASAAIGALVATARAPPGVQAWTLEEGEACSAVGIEVVSTREGLELRFDLGRGRLVAGREVLWEGREVVPGERLPLGRRP